MMKRELSAVVRMVDKPDIRHCFSPLAALSRTLNLIILPDPSLQTRQVKEVGDGEGVGRRRGMVVRRMRRWVWVITR